MSSGVRFDDSAKAGDRKLSIPPSNGGRKMPVIKEDEMEQLKNEFLGLDADGNGEISTEEVENLLKSMRIKLKLSQSEIRRALKQIDEDGDGTVQIKELVNVIERFDTGGVIYKALHQRSTIRKDFERYDADNSGFISKDELVEVIKERTGISVTEKHILRLMKECDENDDDQINYEEFVTLMTKSCMQRRIY